MQRILSLFLLSAMSAGAAGAATPFDGDAMITFATPACATGLADFDIAGGTALRSILLPAGTGDNGNRTRMTVFHDSQAAFNVVFPEFVVPAGTLKASAIGHDAAAIISRDLTYSNYTNIATLDSRTRQIRFSIRDFMFVPGCNVTLVGSYLRRAATGATP